MRCLSVIYLSIPPWWWWRQQAAGPAPQRGQHGSTLPPHHDSVPVVALLGSQCLHIPPCKHAQCSTTERYRRSANTLTPGGTVFLRRLGRGRQAKDHREFHVALLRSAMGKSLIGTMSFGVAFCGVFEFQLPKLARPLNAGFFSLPKENDQHRSD